MMAAVSENSKYDVIIVGAGPSGCILANRLSADGKIKVLLLEAGKDYGVVNEDVKKGDHWFHLLQDAEMHWGLQSVPEPGMANRPLDLSCAKVAGGCGSHNAVQVVRGSRFDYDRWEAQFGCSGWNWEAMLPHFKGIESTDIPGPTRGKEGEVKVRRADDREDEISETTKSFIKVCGYDFVPDYNDGENQEGVCYVQTNAWDNERRGPYTSFISPILNQRSNLTVRFEAQVARVLWNSSKPSSDKKKATTPRALGVELMNGEKIELDMDHPKATVIVTAGALLTPKILMLSGIGDALHLKKVGIPVVVDAPGVGVNLSDHMFVPLMFYADPEGKYPRNKETRDWIQLHLYGTLAGKPNTHQPDFQVYFYNNAKLLRSFPWPPDMIKHKDTAWALFCSFLHPESRGSVRLASADPQAKPIIRTNFLSTERDARYYTRIYAHMRSLAEKFRALYPSTEVLPGNLGFEDDLDFLRKSAGTMWHPVGTVKMGPDSDPMAVVDPQTLLVKGTHGLRVADASLFPELTSGNTHIPVLAVASKVASHILQDWHA